MTMQCADLFAGWGGFSLGAEMAGAEVVWAANHWKMAVDAHAANVPGAKHLCQDLNQANFYDVPDIDILLAAPACQGHSSASQPKRRRFHDALRSTAWAVVSCADAKEPDVIVVENVLPFKSWRLYPAWRSALEALGYSLEEHVLTASHHGVAQRRRRLFVVASRSRHPLDLTFTKQAEPAIGPLLELDGPQRWKPWRGASDSVRRRIRRGRSNHGSRFLTQHVTGHPGEPIRTVTTQDQWAVVDGDRYRPLTVRETARAMGFPDDYTFPSVATRGQLMRGLGNAVCPPVARDIMRAIAES
jgi:DNA (cytosine-5)-methyltransferase 1